MGSRLAGSPLVKAYRFRIIGRDQKLCVDAAAQSRVVLRSRLMDPLRPTAPICTEKHRPIRLGETPVVGPKEEAGGEVAPVAVELR